MESRSNNLTWHEGDVSRADREKLLCQKGVTLWLTGLSGSGKSTIACLVERSLLDHGHLTYRLDGDNIRMGLNKNLSFSADDRTENIRRIAEVARLFCDAGVIVIASFISPYRKDREMARAIHGNTDFVEVFVKASLAVAEGRDPKGLYKKARAGVIKNFTGIDDPYEEPANPDILIDTDQCSAEDAAARVVNYLQERGYLAA